MVKHGLSVGISWVLIGALAGASLGPALAAEEPEPTYPLALADALEMALASNLDLVAAGTEPRISEELVAVEDAGFDLGLTFNPEHSEAKSEVSNPFSPNEFTRDTGTASLGQLLPFGVDYSVDASMTRSDDTGVFVASTSTVESLGLRFNVPLLGTSSRGTAPGRLGATQALRLAEGNLEISREALRREAHRVLDETEGAYWNVLAARAALRTRRLALKRAEDLLALNRKKVEVGTLAPIEITQAEAGVASNEEQVIIAETDVENAEDALLRLLGVPETEPQWNMIIEPTDEPDFQARTVDVDGAVEEALIHRPEIISARRQLENDELSERVARTKTRPSLSLAGNVFPEGSEVEITQLEPPPPTTTKTNSELKDFDNYSWSLGLALNYPIGNRAAKANYSIASLNRQRSLTDVENQEQLIRVDVRRAARLVESGGKRIEAARKNVELQEKKLDAEQKKFENGMSTSFEVLTFQNDLADAELALIRAALDYTRAQTSLERAKGTLLEARNLSIQ
jgi:outer membrane protein TolC